MLIIAIMPSTQLTNVMANRFAVATTVDPGTSKSDTTPPIKKIRNVGSMMPVATCCSGVFSRLRLRKSEIELHLRRRESSRRSARCEQPSFGPRLMLRHHSAPRAPRSPRASATFRSAPQRTPRCCSGRILSRMSGGGVVTSTHSSSQRNRQATVLKHLRPKNQRPLLLDDASGVSLTR